MALKYTPPGVTVDEVVTPSITPLLAQPTVACITGLSKGSVQRSEIVGPFSGTTAITLQGVPADATMVSSSIVSVVDASNGTIYVSGDYTFTSSAHTIARVNGQNIADGSTVRVTYTYTPVDYYLPLKFDDLSTIIDRFGPAYNATSTDIDATGHVSYAASVAFENGASEVYIQPLFYNNSGVRTQPVAGSSGTSGTVANATTWGDSFASLRDVPDINVIVPAAAQETAYSIGDPETLALFQKLAAHIKFMKDDDQEIVGLIGEDSSESSSVAQKATLLSHVSQLQSAQGGIVKENFAFVSPSKFVRPLPTGVGTSNFYVGGQWVAAAIAGMLSARRASEALTREFISGFTLVADPRSKQDKSVDAEAGLLVVENKNKAIWIRHSVTTDTSRTDKRELSVVRAKHRMIESVRDTIDENIIGKVIADGRAPAVVSATVQDVLEALKTAGDLVDYKGVQARTVTFDPTTVEVRFSYKPAFPLNYVNVSFSIDLTTGDVADVTTG